MLPSSRGSYVLWDSNGKSLPHADSNIPVSTEDPQMNKEDEKLQEEDPDYVRGHWGHKAESILSCVGLSVGLGNVWRFPYLAYENGGAAFLIAYLILQLLIGKPLYFMELCMAQYSNMGPTKIWCMNPAAKGIGISMCVISLVVAIYYNVIMAYTLFYFFSSMQKTLPWTVCKEEWGDCIAERKGPPPEPCTENVTQLLEWTKCQCTGNDTIDAYAATANISCTPAYKTSTELFFYKEVIELSSGIEPENMGEPLWRLALCLLLSWIVVVLCLIKGIKSSGKVVYFTATFPYLILLILLIRGALLEGATDGVKFFIIPEWSKLADVKVWVAAAGQMFFSLGVSFGAIIMLGSYNKFRNNVYADALFISVMDLVTSVIAGFVVFCTFGGMAHTIGTTVDKVAKSGYGLAFIAYPEALSNLPPQQLWSVLFFFMLFTLGLDSEFGLLETILTCLQDEFPQLRKYKSPLCVGIGIICFFIALPCVCNGGDYVVGLMDHYGADFSVLVLSVFEVISVMWVYGVMRFLRDVEYMLGKKPTIWPYWVFCWTFCCPVLIAVLFLYRMAEYDPPSWLPEFAQAIGWVLLCVVLVPIPLWFLYHTFRTFTHNLHLSTSEKLRKLFAPTPEWRPADGSERHGYPLNTTGELPLTKTGKENEGFTARF